jgi:hypothetical protein
MIVPAIEISPKIWGPDLSSIYEKLRPHCSSTSNSDGKTYTVKINYPEEIDGIPCIINAVQGERLLRLMGKLDQLRQILETQDEEIKIIFLREKEWVRFNPLIVQFAQALQVDLDKFYIEAKKITSDNPI